MNKHNYQKVTDAIIGALTAIAGTSNVITGGEMANYARDETADVPDFLPEVVVKAENSRQVSGILKLATDHRIPVTPRGSGTGLSGGALPVYGGIVLSLEKMNKILEVDEANFTATAEAGVTLETFGQTVMRNGLYYPPYPGEKTATMGGNVATNAGGMRAVKYGVTRNFVLGLEAVLPTGEIITTGGKYVKCSTGYDLTQLIIGSEGTLAVVTSALFRLAASPKQNAILFIPYNSLGEAIHSVPEILRKGVFPIGIEFMQKYMIDIVEKYTDREMPNHEYDSYLMIIIEADDEDELDSQAERIGAICLEGGAVDIFIADTENERKNLIEMREKFLPAIQQAGIIMQADVVVPRSGIALFVEKAEALTEDCGLKFIATGHAGDGNVPLTLLGEKTESNMARAEGILTETYKTGVSLGGTISGEHGIGMEKMKYLPLAMSPGKITLMQRIKDAFDPAHIMNPGKVIDID